MSSPVFTLDQLGWRASFAQQLSLADLEAAYPARVAAVQRGEIHIISDAGEARVVASSAIPALAVGDWTLIERMAPRVLRVLERCSLIERMAAGQGAHRQLIAANVDTLFVVTSCNEDFNPSRLERYLVLAREARVEPVIVLTKADLAAPTPYIEAAMQIAGSAAVIALDATSDCSISNLSPWLAPGQTVAFVGSSGVGKSTLVNTSLRSKVQSTATIRAHDGRGRHTTTSRTMYALPGGAWVIDTPGMRELRLTEASRGMSAVFEDVDTLAGQCRFRDCRHEGERGCAVIQAVEAGALDERRLTNYLKLQREAEHLSRTVRERRERERHFGRLQRSAQRVQRRYKNKSR